MVKGAILYKGVWLMPGSEANRLHTEKKMEELDKLMTATDIAKRKLEGTYKG